MKKSFWIVLILVILIVIIYFFPKHQQTINNDVVLTDVLRLQQMQISSFDPLDAYHAGHIQIVKQLYNTLVDIDFNGMPIPSLSKRWESKDGRTWRFYLVKNVKFTDNSCFVNKSDRNFTTADVLYTFERLLNKDSKSLGVSYFTNIEGVNKFRNGESDTINGIRIINNYTIDFILSEIDFSFPALLTLPYVSIVNQKAVDFYGTNYNQNPVGTGPFILQTYEPNEKIILLKNKEYWEKQKNHKLLNVDKVIINLTIDDNLTLLMFKNSNIDFLDLSLPMSKQIKALNIPFNYEIEIVETPQLNYYLYNLEKLKNRNIHKGINYAINRNELQKILSGEGTITKGLYPPSIFNNLVSKNDFLNYDPNKAKKYLNNIKHLKLVCFEDILSRSIANFIAKSLKIYDIDITIESVPFPVLVDRLTSGEYDLIQIYWGPFFAEVNHYLAPFMTSSFPPTGNNFNKYSNPEFDKLVTEAKSLPTHQRNESYLKAENIIFNDMPFLLLYFKNTIRVSNEKFDLPLHPLGYKFYKYATKR